MNNSQKLFLSTILALFLAWTGCGPTYRGGVMKRLPQTWNEEQKLSAYYHSFRLHFAEPLGPDKNQFTVFYPRQMTADILKQLEKSMDDFNAILDYNNKDWAQYIAYHKLRPDFEREERAVKALHARIQASNLDDKFQTFMGTRSYDAANHFGRSNPRRLFLERDITKTFPFTSSLIEEAKTRGTLKFLEQVVVRVNQPFHHKEPDPSDPDNFPQKFIWIPLVYDLELSNYKIVGDAEKTQLDNKGHYIEGFVVVAGKKETHPAVKIFFPQGAPMGVLLVDTDRTGESGFGVPNIVERIMAAGVEDVVQNSKMLTDLFLDKKKTIRIPPKQKPPMVAEVVQVGSPIDVWENAPTAQGWIVPFNYTNNLKDNYNVRVEFKKHGNQMPSPDRLKHVEAFVKEWTSGSDRYKPSLGSALEYYRPKPPFDQELREADVDHGNTKKVVVVTKEGDEISGIVVPSPNKFIEDAPFAIVYKEGETWYRLEKQDGSAVFNKRRKTSLSEYQTGVYSSPSDE